MNCNPSVVNYDTDASSNAGDHHHHNSESRSKRNHLQSNLCPPKVTNCVPSITAATAALPCRADDCQKCLEACDVQDCQKNVVSKFHSQGEEKLNGAMVCSRAPAYLSSRVVANPCLRSFFADRRRRKPSTRKSRDGTTGNSTPTTSSSSGSSGGESQDEHHRQNQPPTSASFIKNLNRRATLSFDSAASERSRLSMISTSPPPASCDLVVVVGNKEFYHSSAILGYASEYLKTRMARQGHAYSGKYHISFPFHSPDEWKAVLEFLQPRSLGTAELTWQTLPTILPWFAEFRLELLLNDADHFLLQTVVDSQPDGAEVAPVSVSNLLLLTNIGYACGLEVTQSQARQWIKTKLLQPQQLPQEIDVAGSSSYEEDVSLDWTLADLQFLSRILTEFEELREYLWESSVIIYLPHDLNVEDSYALVSNPLLPYILREGMMQLCIVQRAQSLMQIQKRRNGRSSSPTPTTSTATTVPTNPAAKRKEALTQDLLNVLLQSTYDNLVKFQRETEMGMTGNSNRPRASSRMASKSKRRGRRRHRQNKGRDFEPDLLAERTDTTTAIVVTNGSRHKKFEC